MEKDGGVEVDVRDRLRWRHCGEGGGAKICIQAQKPHLSVTNQNKAVLKGEELI